jgi:hypothetical protein
MNGCKLIHADFLREWESGHIFGPPSVYAYPLIESLRLLPRDWQDSGMRVNLITHPLGASKSGSGTIPLSLTIKPACGLPGDYEFPTDSAALLRLLRQQTDLPSTVLQRFEIELCTSLRARLLGVELSDSVLTKIGYYVD